MKKRLKGKATPLNKEKTEWRLTVNLGFNPEKNAYDKLRQKFQGNGRDAEAFLRDWIAELEKDPEENPWSDELVSEWLDYWLETVVPTMLEWEKNTLDRAKRIINKNIKPYLEDIPLYALEPQHILDLYSYLRTEGKVTKKKGPDGEWEITQSGLAGRTINYVHVILNQSLNHAVDLKKIPANPAKGLTPAKDKEEPKDKWVVLDEKQLATFLEGCQGHRDFTLIFTAAYSGCRESELFGLLKDKIWWDKNAIRIEKALHLDKENPEGFEHRPRTKNKPSTRTVKMPEIAMKYLKDYVGEKEAKGDKNKLAFTELDGSPMHRLRLAGRFSYLANKLGHSGMSFHDLRHTHATILLSNGANIVEVSERLGHANPTITLNTYGHVLPGRDETLAERFNSLIPFKKETE